MRSRPSHRDRGHEAEVGEEEAQAAIVRRRRQPRRGGSGGRRAGPGSPRGRTRRMKTRWKVLLGLAVVLAALLGLNTIVLNQQTKAAEATVEGGEILSLPGGDVQVQDTPAPADATGAPIVL